MALFGKKEKQQPSFDIDYFKKSLKNNGYSDEQVETLTDEISSMMKEQVTEKAYLNYDEFVANIENKVQGLHILPMNRIAACKEVDDFVRQNAEVSNSVRLYASYITFGSAEIRLEEYKVVLNCNDKERSKAAQEYLERWESRTKIKRKIFLIAKDIMPYGDAFLEKIYTGDKITGISYIPAKTMQIKLSRQGHPLKYYQVLDKHTHFADDDEYIDVPSPADDDDKRIIEFETKEIAHFNDGSSLGVTDTPLYNLVILWKFLKILEEAMLIHRMTRARRFIVFFLDVTGKTRQEIRKSVTNFTGSIRSLFKLNIKKGEIKSDESTLPASSDLVIPVTRDSQTKVQSIPSDPSATQLVDLKFYLSRLTTNLLTSYIFSNEVKTGKEEVIEKAFMRMVRIYQRQMEYTLEDLYNEVLAQNNFGDVSARIVFPAPDSNQEMKIVDTIVRRMMIINQLTGTLGVAPPVDWVIGYAFKDLTQFEIKELVQLMQIEAKKAMAEQSGQEEMSSIFDKQQNTKEQATDTQYDNFEDAVSALLSSHNKSNNRNGIKSSDDKRMDALKMGLEYLKIKGNQNG